MPVIKYMPVDEFIFGIRPGSIHLVKEQISQAVMDQALVAQFHGLRQVGLAAADDDRAGIRQAAGNRDNGSAAGVGS